MAVRTLAMNTCTHGPSASTGERCGKPAVTSFVGRDGVTTYYECEEHAINFSGSAYQVGDPVAVRAYGKTYPGTVDHFTRRGIMMVRFRAGNGLTKVVRYEG